MASTLEFVQFVCDQLGEQVSCRRMFGEYGLFAHGKYFACVCGNQLFFKATPGGRMLLGSALGSCQLEPPYPGAAPYLLVTQLEDRELLDVAGYMTFREYDGLDDFFVYHTKMMSPDGSDFRYMEDVRVKNKIIRETRKEALLLKNDDIDLEDIQGELETRAKFISAPLDRMVDDKEISSYETTVVEGQEETFLEDETMRIKIRYLSRGYIREVEIDLGRAALAES